MTESSRSKSCAGTHEQRSVPMLDLRRQYDALRDEVMAALDRVCASQHFILGPEGAAFEREAAAFLGVTRAVGCASGTDALWLALEANGIKPGHSVITSAFSFFASVSSIVRTGARPVLVDVDPHTLNLDADVVARKVRDSGVPNLRAIMPVHLFGQCANMSVFRELAEESGLGLIEDAAQAFGAAWNGVRAGAMSDAAAFSFYPTKNLSAFGDAGCVTTSNAAIADRVAMLRNHGSVRRYHHEEIGGNSRLDEVQAAVLLIKLKYVESWNEARRARAATYDRLFAESGLLSPRGEAGYPSATAPVQLLQTAPQAFHIYHQYVIRVHKRDPLRAFLADCGVSTEVYYPVPLHLQPAFAFLGYHTGDLPVAETAAREVLALPMFPELTDEEQEYVVDAIAKFYA